MVELGEPLPLNHDFVLRATKDIKKGEIVGTVNYHQLPPVVSWINNFFEIEPFDEKDEG